MTFQNRLHGYDPLGLVPKIIIKNLAGAEQYTYESQQLDASPEQDFKLDSWHLHGGLGSDHGYVELVINDKDGVLTDDTIRAKSTIKNQWTLEFYLGKRSTGVNKWLTSLNHGVRIIRPTTNSQKIRVFAIGHNVRYHDRLLNASFFQKKEANGTDYDDTDNDAKLSEIFKDLASDAQHYAYPALGTEGFTTNGVADIDIKLPSFIKRYMSAGMGFNELANIAAAHYGTDPDGDMFLRYIASVSSQMIVTNDLDSLDWQNWDVDRKMILRAAPNWYEDNTIDAGIPFLYAEAEAISIDQEQTSSNAILDLSTKWFAWPFTPKHNNTLKVAPFLSKTGTPTRDMEIALCADDGAGSPNYESIITKQSIPIAKLIAGLGSAKYFEILFDKKALEPNTQYWIVIPQFGAASHYIGLDYQTGTGTYKDSADGVSWTSRTGNVKYRQYAGLSEMLILENTVSRKSFPDRERLVDMGGLLDEELVKKALFGLSETLGKERRIYSGIVASAPTDPLELGKMIKIHDKFNGLTINADLIAYDIAGSAFDGEGSFGTNHVELTVEEFTY